MKLLSLIIPAYNCQELLKKCIDSMLCPQVLDKLDILIVNDGSTDATADTAQSYCHRYPHSIRLISQENKGHGGALNTGCAAATGKYLKVIDADDWVETENLPAFLDALERCYSDVILTHHYIRNIANGQTKAWKCYPERFGAELTMDRIMARPNDFFRALTFHGITYRTDFYRREGITLSEHIFYEDQEYSTIPCCSAETFTCLDLFIYNYRVGDVAQSMSQANRIKRLSHSQAVFCRLLAEYPGRTLTPAGAEFYCTKVKIFVLGHLLTCLLGRTDKAAGRKDARALMQQLERALPRAYQLARKQYRVFTLLNRLHIPQSAWDRLMDSPLYHRLKGNHDLN